MADAGDVARMRAIGRKIESWGVEVRWMPGWETRGATWARVPVGVIDHHDAASIKSGEWGALGYIVANGLAQFQVARCLDGVPRVAICAAGRQAHAGVGGWRFPDGTVVPSNNGNAYLYGVEKANNGLSEPYNDSAIYAADATFRAILEECGNLPASRVVGHKEYGNTPPGGWAGRKGDPVYSMNWRRDRVANFRPRTGGLATQEDWMTTPISEANLDKIRRAVWHSPVAPDGQLPSSGQPWASTRLAGIDGSAGAAVRLAQDAIARAEGLTRVVEGLTKALAAGSNDLTVEDVKQAIREVAGESIEATLTVRKAGEDA